MFYLLPLLIFCLLFGLNEGQSCKDPKAIRGPDGNCYFVGRPFNWYETFISCSIPMVKNAIVNSFLMQFARNSSATDPFWLGAAVDYRGRWSWVDESSLE